MRGTGRVMAKAKRAQWCCDCVCLRKQLKAASLAADADCKPKCPGGVLGVLGGGSVTFFLGQSWGSWEVVGLATLAILGLATLAPRNRGYFPKLVNFPQSPCLFQPLSDETKS